MELTDTRIGMTLVYDVGTSWKQWMIWNNGAREGFFCPEPQVNLVNAPNTDLPAEEIGLFSLAPGEIWEEIDAAVRPGEGLMPKARLRVRAILFDMDNTLLASRIDYAAMRREVGAWLVREGYLAEDEAAGGTTASLIHAATERGLAGGALDQVWAICARHEAEGMRGAVLEPGARETLERLHGRGLLLAVLTNNAEAAAEQALGKTGIRHYFDWWRAANRCRS